MLSPYDYWQYWRNTEDADVGRFLKLFTTLPLDEIARLAALEGAEINEAKKVLATEATALVHGRAAAEQAAETARKTFEEGALADTLPTVEIAARRARQRPRRAHRFRREDGPRRLERRSAPSDQGGRAEGQRPAVTDEKMMLDASDAHGRGRDQALARQEEARAAEGGVNPSLRV